MSIVIFDIDGTLANITHRLHHIKNGNRNWAAFNANVHLDETIEAIIKLNHTLYYVDDPKYTILIVSGRGAEIRETTIKWLNDNLIGYSKLYMRPAGDYRQDTIIKREILDQIRIDFPGEPVAFVIDDRTSVVKMWRDNGLICLQCAEWDEEVPTIKIAKKGLLTLMVGPSGAGKSTWLKECYVNDQTSYRMGIKGQQIISSDNLREDLCSDFRDQSKNPQVFAALHALAKARIENGLDTVIDATNIKRADRMSIIDYTKPDKIRYIVIDRPLEQKRADGGWRNELPDKFDLIAKHHSTFTSQLKDILAGDHLPNVEVIDWRSMKGS